VEVVSLLGPIAGAALPVGIDNEHITAGRCSHARKVGSQRRFPGATFFPEYCNDDMRQTTAAANLITRGARERRSGGMKQSSAKRQKPLGSADAAGEVR